ncbi:MAG TPA: DUF1501 domain-containing protein [Bryobacteraceae bacterium]|nr:DUF1501 domain-containing protein [Bryobacteraceae bacterium]
MTSRRIFLKSSAFAMFGVGSVPTWLSRAVYAKDATSQRKKILIAIFQRGAVDGLNVVVPHGEQAYYALRPSIAIPRPDGTAQSAIDLDGRFGLHPSLHSLKPLWDKNMLAVVHAVGSPDPTRSHFDAQDYMESGAPGYKNVYDGWLNRAMCREEGPSAVRAVSLTPDLPLTLRGRNQALAINNLADFEVKDPRLAATFESMYGTTADQVLNGTGRETFEAIKLVQSIQKTPYVPANGASYPRNRLGQSMLQIARLIKADVGLEVAFTDVGGWDTHVNETGPQPHTGQLANLLRDFGDTLGAFAEDLGDRMADVTVVTMSEFGRTAKENGDRGTDHGHANVMLVMGGAVKGGRVYGEWPGMEREQLHEARDLMVTTDFRTVLSELVSKQLGNRQLATVFPNFAETKYRGILSV